MLLTPEDLTELTGKRRSAAQREKVERLGGAAWVRARIDAAREPEMKGAV